ncbi:hypothetical protein FACS1894166_03650 [Bacilli bacterium]|nr:hypothetical protein FACS1894166_03650 [Bacilli bacterium]
MIQSLSYHEFLNHICELQHFCNKDGVHDIERAINYLYGEFINGNITKVNYEK